MKTTKEWTNYFEEKSQKDTNFCNLTPEEFFAAMCIEIQLDAMKEGARRAVQISDDGIIRTQEETEKHILSIAEQWTVKDL